MSDLTPPGEPPDRPYDAESWARLDEEQRRWIIRKRPDLLPELPPREASDSTPRAEHRLTSAHLPMPNPDGREVNSPAFTAVWDRIKGWDIGAPEHYTGYTGANGSHVKAILDALGLRVPLKAALAVECPECEAGPTEACWTEDGEHEVDIHPERGDRLYRYLDAEHNGVSARYTADGRWIG